jgi:hypothetical protein
MFLQVGRPSGLSAPLERDEVKSTTSTDGVPLASERYRPEVIGESNTRPGIFGYVTMNRVKLSQAVRIDLYGVFMFKSET